MPRKTYNRKNHRWTKELCGDISGTYMTYLKRKAKERNLEWPLSKEYLWDLFIKQDGKCILSGVPITISNIIDKNKNIDRTNHTTSLDRIDNNQPYIEGNVQWVHKQINRIRRELSIEEFLNWCSLCTQHAK